MHRQVAYIALLKEDYALDSEKIGNGFFKVSKYKPNLNLIEI